MYIANNDWGTLPSNKYFLGIRLLRVHIFSVVLSKPLQHSVQTTYLLSRFMAESHTDVPVLTLERKCFKF